VRSLANGASYAYGIGDGRFYITGAPLQGVNPPKAAGPPPLRPDVPCETQSPPDLRSKPAAPPKAIRVNHDAPGAAAAVTRELGRAVRWLRRSLREQGLAPRVREKLLLRSELLDLDRSPKR
jgi:hypothetical protein